MIATRDIKDCIIDNLVVLKYQRVIGGYKLHNRKNYATLYISYDKKTREQKYINIDYNLLFKLLNSNIEIFKSYINNNYKIKEI